MQVNLIIVRPIQIETNMKKRNIYTHDIDLKKVSIKNAPSEDLVKSTYTLGN